MRILYLGIHILDIRNAHLKTLSPFAEWPKAQSVKSGESSVRETAGGSIKMLVLQEVEFNSRLFVKLITWLVQSYNSNDISCRYAIFHAAGRKC
jgi:hypothetical protein